MSMSVGDPGISAGELLRRCGAELKNVGFWAEFQRRFQKRIFLYLLRASHASGETSGQVQEHLPDLAQEVYLRLVQNDGRMLRGFRQDSELAVRAFLARIATTVVSDHFRYQSAGKRQAEVISIDHARETVENLRVKRDMDRGQVDRLVSWIDMERELAFGEDRGHSARDILIFKLFYVDGFTAVEIASFPGFRLGVSGVEAALGRIRGRLRSAQSRGNEGA